MLQPLAATIIGGYLGAGKTTLINHLLRYADGQRLAVLVNEFGALPIDEDLIEAKDDDLISIAGGCVCCSFGSDLTAALAAMADRTVDHVIIESSGVAIPGAIAANIGLLQQYLLSGVVVLADSETIQQHATDEYIGDTVTRQLNDADLIVQTKNDLLSASQQSSVKDWLTSGYPESGIVQSDHGRVPLPLILGQFIRQNQDGPASHVVENYHSEVMTLPDTYNADQLGRALTQSNLGILRAKGFVTDQNGQTRLLQIVGKRFSVTPADNRAYPQLVCIGLRGRLDAENIQQAIATAGEGVPTVA